MEMGHMVMGKYIIILICLWVFFCSLVFFVCIIWSIFSAFKFRSYLKKHCDPLWQKLKSEGAIYYWSYVFKEESDSDQILLREKKALKISTRYALIWFAIFALSLFLTFITGFLLKWKGLI
jgi:ABC-type glycerol-3-phosphate transport system permease component